MTQNEIVASFVDTTLTSLANSVNFFLVCHLPLGVKAYHIIRYFFLLPLFHFLFLFSSIFHSPHVPLSSSPPFLHLPHLCLPCPPPPHRAIHFEYQGRVVVLWFRWQGDLPSVVLLFSFFFILFFIYLSFPMSLVQNIFYCIVLYTHTSIVHSHWLLFFNDSLRF